MFSLWNSPLFQYKFHLITNLYEYAYDISSGGGSQDQIYFRVNFVFESK